MKSNILKIVPFFLFSLCLILVSSCSEGSSDTETPSTEEKEKSKDTLTNQEEKSMDGLLVEMEPASELALEMKLIEKELKLIKKQLESGETVNDWVFEPTDFIDAEATDPSVKDSDFTSYTMSFHQAGKDFQKNKTKNNFELIINACVSCHNQFCTGPIKRIKKLHL